MEFIFCSFVLMICLAFLLRYKARQNGSKQYPPGPPGWPVIGNMLDLGAIPHQTMSTLKLKYGPVLWLKLGSVNTMVIQSAEAASLFFKNHDAIFDRQIPEAMTALDYHKGSIVFGQYGTYWRLIRRLGLTELFSIRKMNESAQLRKKCINKMMNYMEEESATMQARGESGEVNLPHHLFVLAFNLIANLMFSRDLLDPQSKEGREFFDSTMGMSKWAAKPNVADFFPILKWFDPQRVKKGMSKDMGRVTKILEGFIKHRNEEKKKGKMMENKDFVDVLLEYEEDGAQGLGKISDHNVKIVILELFLAGSETTSSTLVWIMAELLRHPDCMKKVKEELDNVVSPNTTVEESDLDSLPYLQLVVKESLRLHPTTPLLIPRKAIKDTIYMGYHVPKGTQVFLNAWAIGRDPNEWDDPLSFKPERFLNKNIDYKGQHFKLIPFGSGRRICMGLPIAHRVVPLVLASLLHEFEWEFGSNVSQETLDMKEWAGLTLRMFKELKAIPKKRVRTTQ
ncbi:hypothetical protein ACFE04_020310 [Oxalis oulophora]